MTFITLYMLQSIIRYMSGQAGRKFTLVRIKEITRHLVHFRYKLASSRVCVTKQAVVDFRTRF
jgi:hypothetical protein